LSAFSLDRGVNSKKSSNKLKFIGIPLDRGANILKCQQAEAHRHPLLTKEKTQKKKKKKRRKLTSKLMALHVLQAPPFPTLQTVPL
jgi:hypothetical protein